MDELKEISFIARHYRKGRFNTERALRRVRPRGAFRLRALRIAAASAAAIFLTAAAAVMLRSVLLPQTEQTEQTAPAVATPTVKVLDFEETPLPAVVAEIEATYGVKVTGVPDGAEGYRLSLHYEATAEDLVATINEILGTEMKTAE